MLENIRLAFQGIWSHMMRSFLTMLGIIIGIASIIAIVSTIKGTSEQIKEDLIGAGSNTVKIYLYDGDNQYDAEYGNSSKTPILTDDVKEEVKDLDHVENATFYYNSTSAQPPSASMAQHSTAARRASTRRTVALSAAEAKVWARPVFFAMGNAATA